MRKIMVMVLGLAMTCGVAFAAVTTGTFGDQNSAKVYRMQVDTDGVIYMPQDTKVGLGTSSPTASVEVYGGTPVTGAGIGQNDVYFGKDMEVDGTIYAVGIKATTGYRTVCVDATGKLFSVVAPTTCGSGT